MFAFEIKDFINKKIRRESFDAGSFIYYSKNTQKWVFHTLLKEELYESDNLFKYNDFSELNGVSKNFILTNDINVEGILKIVDNRGEIVSEIISEREVKNENQKGQMINKETKNDVQNVIANLGNRHKCISCARTFDNFNIEIIDSVKYYHCPYADCNEPLFDSESDDEIKKKWRK